MFLKIYIDGASRGNPGPAGIGIAIKDTNGKIVKFVKEYLGEATNNIAEYRALIRALQEAYSLGAKQIEVNTDSNLMVNQLNRTFKVKDGRIKMLFQEALFLIDKFERVKVIHIRRDLNQDADRLACEAINEARSVVKKTSGVAVFDKQKKTKGWLF